MKNHIDILNQRIIEIYENHQNELRKAGLNTQDKYSNIFCPSVPNEWDMTSKKILIVGQEGHWTKRYKIFENIAACQDWALKFTEYQLSEDTQPKEYIYNDYKEVFTKNCKSFWKRFRFIFGNANDSAFIYANIDSICSLDPQNKYKITENERAVLHGQTIKPVFDDLIKVTGANIVVLFGWHTTSLKHEFKCLYDELYPAGTWETKKFKEHSCIYQTTINNVHYIATYHPSYPIAGVKLEKYKNNEAYDEAILKTINDIRIDNTRNK